MSRTVIDMYTGSFPDLKINRRLIEKTIEKVLKMILELAKQKCPRDTGALVNSGRIEMNGYSGTVTFGDEVAYYALYVHESIPYIQWTIPGTGPKYLETAVLELQSEIDRMISGAIDFIER